jgi:hypothetical protein
VLLRGKTKLKEELRFKSEEGIREHYEGTFCPSTFDSMR